MQIVGHKKQIKYLNNILSNKDCLPHAFLFVGPNKIGKKTIALEFIKSLQCEKSDGFGRTCGKCDSCSQVGNISADFLIIDDDGKEIGISSIRGLKSFAGSRPQHSKFKIAVIDNADSMTIEAQNALLKILEEPSGDKLFFLISSNPDSLLKTILSRVCTIKFFSILSDEIEDMIENITLSKNDLVKIKNILPIIGYRSGIVKELGSDPALLDRMYGLADEFFYFAGSNINERFKYIEKKSKSEDFNLVFILEGWIMIMREALFKKVRNCDLIDIDRPLKEFIGKRSAKNIADSLRLATDICFLSRQTNINQRLAFETLAINL